MREKKSFKAVELKYLDDKTINEIRIWRNAEFVRKNSFTQHEITIDEHKAFIENLKQDINRGLFVFYLNDEPFGIYHYKINPTNNSIMVSDYLTSEEYKYLGYGEIMSFFIMYINFNIFKADIQSGQILDVNKKLLSSCRKANVDMCICDEIIIDDKPHNVYQVKFTKEYFENISSDYKKLIYYIVKEEKIEDCVLF